LDPVALLWQVGCEFVAAARKLEPLGFTQPQAWDALVDMQALADVVLLPNRGTWSIARGLQGRFQLQFWDALIVAACIQGGVKTLYVLRAHLAGFELPANVAAFRPKPADWAESWWEAEVAYA
jgi:hypothetical protein